MQRLFILGIGLVCLVVYSNSLNNEFVFDDLALVVHNPLVKSLKLLPLIFKKGANDYYSGQSPYDRMYRPGVLLTYWFDYRLWGVNPSGFHLTNILIHLANTILIYYLFLQLFHHPKLCAVASLLFLVHPLHTSVVTYISGRADLGVSFWMLVSIIFFLRFLHSKNRLDYLSSLTSGLLALLFRESALLLFMFLALIIFMEKVRPKYYLYLIPFLCWDLLYLGIRFFLFGVSGLAMHPAYLSFTFRWLNFFNLIPRYLWLMLFPFNLHLLRVTPFIHSFIEPKAIFSLIFILGYILLLVKFHRQRLLFFCLIWFLLGLIPAFFYLDGYSLLGGAMMAESWVYLSSIGFLMILSYCLHSFHRLAKIMGVCLVIFYSLLTMVNNRYWKDNLTLHKRILHYTSGRNPIRKDLIDAYLSSGQFQEALEEIKEFERYYRDLSLMDVVWGNYYFFTGEIPQAIQRYNTALVNNRHFFLYYRLSSSYRKLKQWEEAINAGLEGFKINPYFVPNLIQLGDLYRERKEFAQAEKYYQLAWELDPYVK